MAKKQKSTATGAKKGSKAAKSAPEPGKPQLYTLAVVLTAGPMTEKFDKENPEIARTIQIRGDQTLEVLHDAIFDAFDRFDEHMYEFEFGKRPMDGPKYVLSVAADNGDDEEVAGLVEETTIESLGLKKGRSFNYWFDFGDDWWHRIDVMAVEAEVPRGAYPKVTSRIGKSPPQYQFEEEE